MPHHNQHNAVAILKNKLNMYVTYSTFIICSDFNSNRPPINNILSEFNLSIKREPHIIKTCCAPNHSTHRLSFDHIYISSNAIYKKYKTDEKKIKYTSDHLPLYGVINYI